MLFVRITAILGLAASFASAVNIKLYASSRTCSGSYAVCSNVASGTCCYSSTNHRSIRFDGGSGTRNLRGFVTGCNNLIISQNAGIPFCMSRGDGGSLNGGVWRAASLLRRGPAEDSCPADQGGCKDPAKPDLVVLADGTEYDVKQLDDAQLKELSDAVFSMDLAFTETVASAEDIPKEFDALRIAA
ncbi:hypothetical protein MCOR07_007134 [Pyricularia oryzae]|uniref:Uncharacterized protein n=2 Tax=Pyricularia TaxID=48558 RepID=A0ABQ8NW93_PYRGI|nr:hypothetical protein MCOR19_010002 [Pyricularia oryzae]KAI6302979.1 hypothetical protein MCOR33_001755 [Pyricularia grisea]KAI6289992.1 hypothetical protein MCOR34_010557 [Pyricularia oryzae]KAI6371415.1 hypothetical protein MCOR32_006191 [Pyricularia oryzae]KAI6388203.1 hypothetical protein MCOR23_010786 [Pyricularia oryzae]